MVSCVAIGLWRYIRFVRRLQVIESPDEDWAMQWRQLLASRGVNRRIPFRVSRDVGPALIRLPSGYQVVVPETAWKRLTSRQRQLILCHELAHYEHGDLWRSLAVRLLALPHWFNPLSWWVVRKFEECTEWLCDYTATIAAASGASALEYARALMQLGSSPILQASWVGAAQGSRLFQRIQRLISNPFSEDSRVKKAVLVSMALGLLLVGGVRIHLVAKAAAQGESAAKSEVKPASVDPTPQNATKSLTAEFPCGIAIGLLGLSEHPSKANSWWRPDGSPLVEPPCDPLKGSVSGGPDHVVRELAVQFHNLPSEPVSREVLFDPSYNEYSGDSTKRPGKDLAGLEAMTVSLPDQKTVTVRVRVAAGPWETVCETRSGSVAIGTRKGGFAFSPVAEKDGGITITVTHDIAALDSRVIALGRDGREHRASSSGLGASSFHQITATFSKLLEKNVKVFRVQTRPYQQVEFRNVSIQPGWKTDVQIVQPTTPPVAGKAERPAK